MQQKTVLCNDKARLYTTKIHAGRLMSWKVVKSRCNKKLCYATTKHDFTRQETYAGRLMSWKVVKSREKQMQQKRCYATTKHDFTRQDMYAGKRMS